MALSRVMCHVGCPHSAPRPKPSGLAHTRPGPPPQDSLGGNAKTMIVANVSPSTICAQVRRGGGVRMSARTPHTHFARRVQHVATSLAPCRTHLPRTASTHPHPLTLQQETLSTLYFARRAKHIKNRATVNVDVRGDVALMEREIAR